MERQYGLSVIIPVHNGGDNLIRCLESVAASTRPPEEIVVVDDCSTDGSAARVDYLGARVVSLHAGPHGPAVARNRGASESRGDILVFLDADVMLHSDTLERLERYLTEQPEVAALFGSYDADPPAPGVVTRYKNLSHHYVHQRGRRESFTFWSGCGAIRREAFLAIGGFNEDHGRPCIEDIELGYRLRGAGYRVWLCSDVQVTHLKRWNLTSMLRVDILDRAVPWTKLIVRNAELHSDLNLNTSSRLSALAAWTTALGLALGFWFSWGLVVALLAAAMVVALNADLYRFFRRRGGLGFALAAAGLHAFYLLYSSVTFVVIALPAILARHGLALLLLATLLKGLAWSVVVPPLHAHDEVPHFLYAQSVERSGTLQVRWGDRIPEEMALLRQVTQLDWAVWPARPLDLSDRAGVARLIVLLDDPVVKRIDVPYEDAEKWVFRSFTSYHPPLYYLLSGLVQAALESQSILIRLLASRWVSLLLALATVLLSYRAGRELWPGRRGWPLLLATLVSFQPMVTFSGAVMGNLALETTLFSVFLLVSLKTIRGGLTGRRGAVLGGIVAAGLLTRASFWSVLPLLGLLFIWSVVGGVRGRRGAQALWPWVLVLAMPVLASWWWYGGMVVTGSDTSVVSYRTLVETQGAELLPSVLAKQLRDVPQYLRMYWGYFGWNETVMPRLLLTAMTLVTAISCWETGWWLIRRASAQVRKVDPAHSFALLFLGCAPLVYFAFYSYLDLRLTRDLGGRFDVQGRYFLPTVIAQMAWLTLGLIQPLPRRLRRLGMWSLGAGSVALNFYALFGVIVPRYYGEGGLLLQLERVAILQPVPATIVLALCAAYVTLGLLVVAVLWRELAYDQLPTNHASDIDD